MLVFLDYLENCCICLQRSRKCSIVQEDEEEEDISSCSGREELVPPLNRRGSRSEGRLNLALQERLAESERRKPLIDKTEVIDGAAKRQIKVDKNPPQSENLKWRMGKSSSLVESPVQAKIIKDMVPKTDVTTTTIITDSSTISIPIITTNSPLSCQAIPKYKTMPSPTRTSSIPGGGSPLQLNEIFEEGDGQETPRPTSRQFVSRNQNRTSYEQRRSKFHKARTASCSSSDASDDDSEKRKKRAHKLNNPSAKPFQGRRDSHDDSSDSQEPGTGAGTGGNNNQITTVAVQNNTSNNQDTHKNGSTTNGGNTGGRKNAGQVMLGRRHKASRRRNGETRLRESQSLNRITEVQEDGAHALVIATSVVGTQGVVNPKVKGIGARILQGLVFFSFHC